MTGISRNVLVVIGTGGMGQAAARRLAAGRQLIIADFSTQVLESTVKSLQGDGHIVEGHVVNVSDLASVQKLAETAGKAGHIDAIIHTAGVSPVMANSRKIIEVNLLGTANVIDAFLSVASTGTSLVCIASMAGHTHTCSSELEQHLATSPLEQLLKHPEIDFGSPDELHAVAVEAYGLSKRGNRLRVQSAARAWGAKGARINTISPGLISTPMGTQEVAGPNAANVKRLIGLSAMQRIGTADDIASVVAFLAGPESSFITGTDILIDGGAVPALRWPGAT